MSTLAELMAQRQALDAQIEAARKAGLAEALQRVRALMAETGVTLEDLAPPMRRAPAAAKPRKPVAIKYSDGAGNTWSGRGFKPAWVRDWEKRGLTLDMLKVKTSA